MDIWNCFINNEINRAWWKKFDGNLVTSLISGWSMKSRFIETLETFELLFPIDYSFLIWSKEYLFVNFFFFSFLYTENIIIISLLQYYRIFRFHKRSFILRNILYRIHFIWTFIHDRTRFARKIFPRNAILIISI